MSETTIEGYSLTAADAQKHFGSGSEELIKQIISEHKDELADCAMRFKYSENKTISPEEAVRAVINGDVPDDHVYDCTCVLAPILSTIGSRLEDETPAGSLNYNIDYWNENFEKIFSELGLHTLANAWESSSFALTKSGATAEWPIVSLLDKNLLEKCKSEFDRIKFEQAFDGLSEGLFTQKSDDANSTGMRSNIECLHKWISTCLAEEKSLFIIFDGDA